MSDETWDNARPADGAGRRRKSGLGGASPHQGDRLPPHSVEAEQGVLGCILLSPADGLNQAIEKLRAGSLAFYEERHREIYGAMLALHEKDKPVDTMLLKQYLADRNLLEGVGGLAYLAELPDKVPSAVNLGYYIEIVLEKYALRKMVQTMTDIVGRIYALPDGANAAKLLDEAEVSISKLTEEQAALGEEHVAAVMERVINEIEYRYHRGHQQLRGLPTGPQDNYVDKLVRGIRETYYMVIAGRPGSGKTSWAMNIVRYLAMEFEWAKVVTPENRGEFPKDAVFEMVLAKDDKPAVTLAKFKGVPVVVFSIEMDADCLVERMLFETAGVDSSKFSQGYASQADQTGLVKASAALRKANIHIDATPEQSIGRIAAKARRMVEQYGIKNPPRGVPRMVFVLDYIQLVEQEGGNGFDRVKEMTKISRKIMALKKQLKCPWLVLAQMNRNIETSERERAPVLSDLKDCGALEQDADLVVFTYKTPRKQVEEPGPNGGKSDAEILAEIAAREGWGKSATPYRVDMVIPKNRFGPTGQAKMVFQKNFCRFEDRHLFFVRHGFEGRNAGESRRMEGGDEAGMEENE